MLAFEATVMAGTPSIRLAKEALAGCKISEVRGILNGTTNYILTQMESGIAYNDALAQAQQLGYAEADPTADVEGWDAAGKTLIVANAVFGKQLALSDLNVKGISEILQSDVEAARKAGERWKLIARVTPEGGSVQPVRLPVSDPLANVFGTTNAITYTTNLLGSVTLVGAGAGRLQTGFGLLSDLIAVQRST
jgi:homoserine dehydrogenase